MVYVKNYKEVEMSEQPVTIALESSSSYMHREEAPEEESEEVILLHELPLKTGSLGYAGGS